MSPAAGNAGDASDRAPATPALIGERVLDALGDHPGGPQLLSLAGGREDVALVGGAVRDLLLERRPRELDVVVASDAADFAQEIAANLASADSGACADSAVSAIAPPQTTAHERFGTALVAWAHGRVDVAQRRAESYPAPGALPQVRAGTVEEDLRRRDFTVNAIAVSLGGSHRGETTAAEHALDDLAAGRLRVLHERSFLDDPTRLLRLARYSARLGFVPERRTSELAADALAGGALATVSGARVGAELRLALGENDPVAALSRMSSLGVLAAVHPGLRLPEQIARRALALLPADGRPDLLLMASLLLALSMDPDQDAEAEIHELLDRLEFTAPERERVMRSALVAPSLVEEMVVAARPSQLHEALFAHTLEAVALGGALGDESTTACGGEAMQWFDRLRHVRLLITGDDLIAAGIPAGPQIGQRLAAALARKLDGELSDGREAELSAALEEADA
jgi:tRNA nucleotidyltransferase (CCA-adding enzyme)